MTEPGQFDPTGYAAQLLAQAGIPVTVSDETPGAEDHQQLVRQFIEAVTQEAQPGWHSLHAAISMAGGEEIAAAVAVGPDGNREVFIAPNTLDPLRMHRRITAGRQGPWLRLLFDCDSSGTLNIEFDYGETEFPPEHLLPGEAYLRDLEEYPHEDVPVWLLAHIGNEGQQMRGAAVARKHAAAGDQDVRVADDEIPPLPVLWARIAVLTALTRAIAAPVVLRGDPSFAFYLTDGGGCTLARLPGGRAVLSGGSNGSRLLSAAYKGATTWPDLYRGAPDWVHNLYLDPRTGRGMLSFCYWWDDQHWYRAGLPEAAALTQGEAPWQPTEEIIQGVPGVWTAQSTAELAAVLLAPGGVELANSAAALNLVAAAEAGIVSEDQLSRLFPGGVPETFDIAEALAQFDAAGVVLPVYPPLDRAAARKLVIDYCRSRNFDYPLDKLVADRVPGGWKVFTPVDPAAAPAAETTFLVADDGQVEEAADGVSPTEAEFGFAARFAARVRGS